MPQPGKKQRPLLLQVPSLLHALQYLYVSTVGKFRESFGKLQKETQHSHTIKHLQRRRFCPYQSLTQTFHLPEVWVVKENIHTWCLQLESIPRYAPFPRDKRAFIGQDQHDSPLLLHRVLIKVRMAAAGCCFYRIQQMAFILVQTEETWMAVKKTKTKDCS